MYRYDDENKDFLIRDERKRDVKGCWIQSLEKLCVYASVFQT